MLRTELRLTRAAWNMGSIEFTIKSMELTIAGAALIIDSTD